MAQYEPRPLSVIARTPEDSIARAQAAADAQARYYDNVERQAVATERLVDVVERLLARLS